MNPTAFHTAGGAAVTGNVTSGTFIGRDQIIVLSGYTGAELERVLARRWGGERSFGWTTRFRCLVRDYERLSETLVGLHFIAFAILMARRFITLLVESA